MWMRKYEICLKSKELCVSYVPPVILKNEADPGSDLKLLRGSERKCQEKSGAAVKRKSCK